MDRRGAPGRILRVYNVDNIINQMINNPVRASQPLAWTHYSAAQLCPDHVKVN